MKQGLLALLALSCLCLSAFAEIKKQERKSLLDSDPEVVYLERTVKKPIELLVKQEAPVFSDKEGKNRVGFLKANQIVELEAMTEKVYRVRGEGLRHGISGWVGPWAFSSKDPDFVANLKTLYGRQIEVQNLIAKNEVAVGMTLEEVGMSLGKPVKTSARRTATGQTGVWEYIEYEEVKHYITRVDPISGGVFRQLSHITREEKSKTSVEFENEVVTAIQESEDNKGGNVRIILPPVTFGFGW